MQKKRRKQNTALNMVTTIDTSTVLLLSDQVRPRRLVHRGEICQHSNRPRYRWMGILAVVSNVFGIRLCLTTVNEDWSVCCMRC